jgi:hypothetical protein
MPGMTRARELSPAGTPRPARRDAMCVVLLASLLVHSGGDAQDVVDWPDAAQCVGRVCGIRGTVVSVENDGPSFRLYFDAQRRDVRVILMRGWLVTWPAYEGQTIVATGKVDRFRDHVEVIVLDPRNVVIIGAAASPASEPATTPPPSLSPTLSPTPAPTVQPTAAPTPAATAEPTRAAPVSPSPPADETEQLRQRVRELEERVRELEGR